MLSRSQVGDILEALQKGVATGDIESLVPEDLEVEAHNTLWNESDKGELTLLKLLPSVPAYNVVHEVPRVTSFGHVRGSGFFGQKSLPPEGKHESDRLEVAIRLLGDVGSVFLLPSHERTVQALGAQGAVNIERAAARRRTLWRKNREGYFADTRTHRDGTGSVRFAGLYQLIDAGSAGTQIIDMEGEDLSVTTIRDKMADSFEMFGVFNTLIMSGKARVKLEESVDDSRRLNLPVRMDAYMLGQRTRGVVTEFGTCFFETDNVLAPRHSRPQYSAAVHDDAPSTRCTATATAQADGTSPDVSKWDAIWAGNVYYVLTEMVNELEGLGRRVPAAGYEAVAAGEEVALVITPSSSEVEAFKVYRGTDADTVDPTDAWFIFEVASSTDGSDVTTWDDNLFLPNTSWAFGLRINSAQGEALFADSPNAYAEARLASASFLENTDRAGNTVAMAHLGPPMGIMPLAAVLATASRDLLYSACAPEVRNFYQNFAFINVANS